MLLPCAAVVLAAVAALWAGADRLTAPVLRFIQVDSVVLPAIDAWTARAGGGEGVVLFGDSAAGDLGPLLVEALGARGRSVNLLSAVHPGFRPIHFYSLLDRVEAGRPQVVLIEVNFRTFADAYVGAMPEVSRFLSPVEVRAVRPALISEGIGLFDPWLYRFQAATGLLYGLPTLRLLAQTFYYRVTAAASEWLGLRVVEPAAARVLKGPVDSSFLWLHYGHDPAATAQAAVLRTLRERLQVRGITVRFYVTPLDVDRIAGLGLTEALGVDAKLAALRTAIGAAPDEWIDLHATAHSPDFRDFADHLQAQPLRRVAEQVADALAPLLGAPHAPGEQPSP